MAVISNLIVAMTAQTGVFDRKMAESAGKVVAFQRTVAAIKDARLNISASAAEVQTAVASAKRLLASVARSPAAALITVGFSKAPGAVAAAAAVTVNAVVRRLAATTAGTKLVIGAERIADNVAIAAIRSRGTIDKLKSWAMGTKLAIGAERIADNVAIAVIRGRQSLDRFKASAVNLAAPIGTKLAGIFGPFAIRTSAAFNLLKLNMAKVPAFFGLQGFNPLPAIGRLVKSFAKTGVSVVKIPIAFAADIVQSGASLAAVGVGQLLKSLVPVGVAGLAAAAGILAVTHGAAEMAHQNLLAAQTLGATTQNLGGLQIAAKQGVNIDADEFTGLLEKMQKKIGETAGAAHTGITSFDMLGLSVGKLSAMGGDRQFLAIADAIAKLPNPAQRSAIAVDLMGRSGLRLLPVLNQGRAALEQFIAKQVETGAALNTLDTAKLMAVQEAFNELGTRATAVKNQIALAFGPTIAAVIEEVLATLPAADQMRARFVTGLRYIGYGIAAVMDAYRYLKVGILAASVAIASGLEVIIETLASISGSTALEDAADRIGAMTSSMSDDINGALTQQTAMSQVDGFFANVEKRANASAAAVAGSMRSGFGQMVAGADEARQGIADSLKDLDEQIRSVGVDDTQKPLMVATKRLTDMRAQMNAIQTGVNQIDVTKDLDAYLSGKNTLNAYKVEIDFQTKGLEDIKAKVNALHTAQDADAVKQLDDKIAQVRSMLDDNAWLAGKHGNAGAMKDIDDRNKTLKALQDAQQTREDVKTDAQKLADRIKQLNADRRVNGGLSDSEYARAVAKARQEFQGDKALPKAEEVRDTGGLRNLDGPNPLVALQKKMLDEQTAARKAAEATAKSIGSGTKVAVVSIGGT